MRKVDGVLVLVLGRVVFAGFWCCLEGCLSQSTHLVCVPL